MTNNAAPYQSNIASMLRDFVERIERLEEQKKGYADDIKEVRKDAKAEGIDLKTLNEMLKLRKMSSDKRAVLEFNRDVYMRALGLADGPA